MQQQLSSVADVVNSRVGSLTLQRQHKIWGELANFLAPYGIGVDAATPEDVCRFFDSQYQHEHKGTVLPDGRIVAAPHSMQNARSALSAVFRLQGCSQPWSDLEGIGNPCDSLLVSQYLIGYCKQMTEAGYAERCAVPFTEMELLAALQALCQAASQHRTGSVQQYVAIRQGACGHSLYTSETFVSESTTASGESAESACP